MSIGKSKVNPLRKQIQGAFFCSPLARVCTSLCVVVGTLFACNIFLVLIDPVDGQAANTQKHWWSDTFEITMSPVRHLHGEISFI